jgi:antitoxin MazE
MQVSKWGDSLVIRLPAAVVEAHKLKEGDEIEVSIAGKRDFKTARDRDREKAIESLRRLARPLPSGFKFDREELNER